MIVNWNGECEMIQEIHPHRLRNEFVPGSLPQPEDIVICVRDNTIMVGESEGNVRFPLRKELPDTPEWVYLFSVDNNRVYYAVGNDIEALPGFRYMTIRDIRWKIGSPLHLMYAMYTAWHLICWYRDNRYCGRCGHATRHSDKERALVCGNCGNTIYPRLVPAVIVGIIWGDKILMTKYANRNVPFYALVAGFTEIGETMEECVAREVMEETGLKVKNIRYYKSQPWGSVQDILMGFYCDVDGDPTIRIDRSELKEGIWVERKDIQGQPDDWSLTHHMMMTFKEGKEPRV